LVCDQFLYVSVLNSHPDEWGSVHLKRTVMPLNPIFMLSFDLSFNNSALLSLVSLRRFTKNFDKLIEFHAGSKNC